MMTIKSLNHWEKSKPAKQRFPIDFDKLLSFGYQLEIF